PMLRGNCFEDWILIPAFLHYPFATWRKRTMLRFVKQQRWNTFYRNQALLFTFIHTRQTANQADGIRVGWIGKQLIDWSFFNNIPAIHYHYALREPGYNS